MLLFDDTTGILQEPCTVDGENYPKGYRVSPLLSGVCPVWYVRMPGVKVITYLDAWWLEGVFRREEKNAMEFPAGIGGIRRTSLRQYMSIARTGDKCSAVDIR